MSTTAAELADDLAEQEVEHWTERYAGATTGVGVAGVSFVLVRVGGERFAVALDDLDEVACVNTAIALPHVSTLVLGLANIRGELLPLLDTATLLGVTTGYRLGSTNRTLVIRDQRGRRVGLPVDRVEAVEELDTSLFQPLAPGDPNALILRTGLAENRDSALVRLDLGPLRGGTFRHF